MKRLGSVAFMAIISGCSPTSDRDLDQARDEFAFTSFEETAVDILVVDGANAPLRGVGVSVEQVYDADLDDTSELGYRVFLRGVTDIDGRVQGNFRLPSAVTSFDVIVHRIGLTGPWSDTTLRDSLGEFAPSSRQTRNAAAQVAMTVALEVDA